MKLSEEKRLQKLCKHFATVKCITLFVVAKYFELKGRNVTQKVIQRVEIQ